MLIITNAAILGFRHAIDWDHIAALMDITASSSFATGSAQTFDTGGKRALWLSGVYAMGHCAIVILIGIITCFCAGLIPVGFDTIMEKIVGLTLVVFGAVVAIITANMINAGSPIVPISRMNVLVSGLKKGWQLWRRNSNNHDLTTSNSDYAYGHCTAFGLGIIHGAGLETASQVLLLAAIGASASRFFAACVLTSFSFGFLTAIMLIALFTVQGSRAIANMKPLYLTSALLTALFSTLIGVLLLTGNSSILPDLSKKIL